MGDEIARTEAVAKAYAASLPLAWPSPVPTGVLDCHVAIEDFSSTLYPGCLTIEIGDVVAVHHRDGGKGWWAGVIAARDSHSGSGSASNGNVIGSSSGDGSNAAARNRIGWFPADVVDYVPLLQHGEGSGSGSSTETSKRSNTEEATLAPAVVQPLRVRPASILAEQLVKELSDSSALPYPSKPSPALQQVAEENDDQLKQQQQQPPPQSPPPPPQQQPAYTPPLGNAVDASALSAASGEKMMPAITEVSLFHSHGAWWELSLDKIPWAALLPEKDAVVSFRSESNSTEVGTPQQKITYRFFLELADASKGTIEVVAANTDVALAVISDIWVDPPSAHSSATLKR